MVDIQTLKMSLINKPQSTYVIYNFAVSPYMPLNKAGLLAVNVKAI